MFQALQNKYFNWKYQSKDNVDSKELVNATITILGQIVGNYPCEKRKELIQQLYSRTIWFSYRKNFPGLVATQITSDAGWGCMVRAGQMILAQILRNHMRGRPDVHNYQQNLLNAFVDDDLGESKHLFTNQPHQSPYSIQKIAVVASMKLNKAPGEWHSPESILNSLSELHNGQAMIGSQDLQIYVGDSLLYDNLQAQMYGLKVDCQHIIDAITNKQPGEEINKICNKCPRHEQPKSLAILLVTRLGLDKLNPIYIDTLLQIMDLPYFQGIISGKGDKAFYIIGRFNNKLIYLDPHFVQESVSSRNVLANIKTYFTDEVRTMPIEELSPSMAIGFYCKDEEQLQDLFTKLEQIKSKQQEDGFFVFLRRTTPDDIIVPSDSTALVIEIDDEIE